MTVNKLRERLLKHLRGRVASLRNIGGMGDAPTLSKGWWHVEAYEADGVTKVGEWDFPNGGTTGGLNDLLASYFAGGAARPQWFLGLVANAGFTAFAGGDTMTGHGGWNELTAYSGASRPQWTPLAVAGGAITNTGSVNFTINANGTQVYGLFLCSDSTIGGAAGVLWATGAFPSVQTLNNGQILKCSYVNAMAG